jgi:AraC-like DNA-binding protein
VTREQPRYRERRPSPALGPYVQCHWCITAGAAPSFLSRICPDGCADIIIDLAASLPTVGRVNGRRTFAVGTMRRASRIPLAGRIHLQGVRFRPGAAERFFRVPMHELTDRMIPLLDLWGGAADLESRAEDAPTALDRITRIEELLLERLGGAPDPAAAVRYAIGFIARTTGQRPVRDLERAVGLGARHLERRFRETVGVSPKLFSRVVRFRRALTLLRQPAPFSWSRLAVEAGYYDQAHLIREVKALAGITPAGLAAELRQVGFVQYESDVPQ